MQLTFNSIEEVREFVKGLKGTRGGKNDDAADAPAPINPPLQPTGTQFGAGSAGSFQGFGNPAPAGGSPFGGGAPAVHPLVGQIIARIDSAIASGQPPEAALGWFRSNLGPEAAQATMDQVKTVFLPRLASEQLAQIAKLMGIVQG